MADNIQEKILNSDRLRKCSLLLPLHRKRRKWVKDEDKIYDSDWAIKLIRKLTNFFVSAVQCNLVGKCHYCDRDTACMHNVHWCIKHNKSSIYKVLGQRAVIQWHLLFIDSVTNLHVSLFISPSSINKIASCTLVLYFYCCLVHLYIPMLMEFLILASQWKCHSMTLSEKK